MDLLTHLFRPSSPCRNLLVVLALCCALPGAPETRAQELRGHGGPVRAVAVSPDGALAVTGSFDQSVILWRLGAGSAEAVLRFHEGSVNAALALGGGRFASAGEDGRIAIWQAGRADPVTVLAGHAGPIVALALSPAGDAIASASWDGTARVTPLGGGTARVLEGHRGNVNGVAFLPGGAIATSGYDATLRIWPQGGGPPQVVQMPAVLNAVVAAADGEIIVAGGDGRLRFVGPDGAQRGELAIAETPLVALAITTDSSAVAAGGIRGNVSVVERAARMVRANLVGPGLPVWSLAFMPDGAELLSGGADRLVRRWNAVTGEHIGAVVPRASAGPLAELQGQTERGAQVFRACAACHTVTPDDGARAGPTLHGVFGRRIATAPGYVYSPALQGMDIVWTRETIARLFEIGPNAMTPGTKMPEQVIIAAEDRTALVDWLEKVTK